MLLYFRIRIRGIKKPPVWRELTVPASMTFDIFHDVIQAAFGWTNSHLHFFSREGFTSSTWIKIPDEFGEEDDVKILDSTRTKLERIFPANQKYTYLYDYGDNWQHDIKLLKISLGKAKQALLTAGKGACPPEDCGGASGFEAMKEAIADPENPEREELLAWIGLEEGEAWDPAAFNLEEAQERVRAVFE